MLVVLLFAANQGSLEKNLGLDYTIHVLLVVFYRYKAIARQGFLLCFRNFQQP